MVKVCHMSSVHQRDDTRIFHKECVSLARAGYDVSLVIRGDSCEVGGVHIIGVGNESGSRLSRMLKMTRSVYRVARALDADIYHFHDPELLPYGLKLKKAGKTVIFDSHEHTVGCIEEKEYLPKPCRGIIQSLYSHYQDYVCKRIDAVVTATPNVTQFFSTRSRRAIDVCNFPIVLPKNDASNFAERTISFAGGISGQWNHDKILQAIAQIPGCTYHLCGFAGESYLNTLKSLPGWQQVVFYGRVPFSKVASVLSMSSVGMSLLTPGANTNHQNGNMANTKIFEEMMAGLPVVCTDFVLWREFVERWHCGICIDPENVDEIASALRYLFDHPDEARKMGENGRRAVETEFNWAHEEKKLLALYAELSEI